MEKEICINRVLRDMRLMGIISEDNIGEARVYANALWAAGWHEGTRYYGQCNGKKIIQYDKYGAKLGEFDNQLKAAKEVGYSDAAILRSLKSGRPTRAKHIWMYAEEDKDSNKGADAEVEGQETDSKGT